MPNGRVKRLLGRLRSQNTQPIVVDSSPTQRAKPRTDFTWNDLKIILKMLLVKSTISEAFYRELLIPGSMGQIDNELYVRLIQAFCLVPFFKVSVINRQYSDTSIRFILGIRDELIPYLKAIVALARDYKWSVLRALDKVEPENPKVRGIEDCYLLGDALLVSPVVVQGAIQRYVYLPAGNWYNYWSNHLTDGSQYVAVDAPLQILPIFVRAGTVLPLQKHEDKESTGSNHSLLYRVYPGQQETVLYEDDTEGFDEERKEYRWIYITCGWEEGKFVINRRIAGQFVPPYSIIRVEVVGLEHQPLSIRIDRRPAPLWYFDQGILEFTTDTFQIIEIMMEEVPAET